MLWMKSVYGDEAPAAWAQLAKDGHRHQGLVRGLRHVPRRRGGHGALLHHLPAYHLIAESKPQYRAAAFEEGHYRQVEVAAKLKGATQGKLADQFLQFMVSPAFQNEIPGGNWMYPVTTWRCPRASNR
jgi:thiamine transport system substrate-binding protein